MEPVKDSPLIRVLCVCGLFVVVGIAAWTGYRGVDFGVHWDEDFTLRATHAAVNSGVLLPGRYEYPSVIRDLALLSVGPAILAPRYDPMSVSTPAAFPNAFYPASSPSSFQEGEAQHQRIADLVKSIEQPAFRLRVRTVLLTVSLFTCVWVYLLVLAWRNDSIEALLAASLMASSWQVAYHSRWIAPDTVLMQFSALTMLLTVCALRSECRATLWLRLAAVAAGLGCSTKYPGAVLLLPVLLAALTLRREKTIAIAWTEFLSLPALFCLSLVLTTPAILVEPGRVVADVFGGLRHYHGEHHAGQTIAPGPEHLWRTVQYFAAAAFSQNSWVAVLFFTMALTGIYYTARREWKMTVILLGPPVLYVAAFALQAVMNVRNLLLVFPVLAVFAAHGTKVGIQHIPWRSGRVIACAVVILAILLNLAWLVRASESIVHRATINHGWNIEAYLRAHPHTKFYLSDGVAQRLSDPVLRSLTNIASLPEDLKDNAKVIYDTTEGDRQVYPANRHGFYEIVSGPYDVDLDYYPAWIGDPRVVAVSFGATHLLIASIKNDEGLALTRKGDLAKAVVVFRDAIQIDPNYAKSHNNLGVVLAAQGQYAEAIAQHREVLRRQPDQVPALNSLAWVLATAPEAGLRDGAGAVQAAKRACELTGHKDASLLDTLAAAYAEAGRLDEAVKTAERALALAQTGTDKGLAAQIETRLQRYRQGQPWREK